jgi:hypothetical protein
MAWGIIKLNLRLSLTGALFIDSIVIDNMAASQIYIALSIAVLAIIALMVFFVRKGKKEKRLSKLAGIAFAFVISGILFSEDQVIGYSLLGIGVTIAIIDIIIKLRK